MNIPTYSTALVDAWSPYCQLRFYQCLRMATDKDAVLRQYAVPVEVPFALNPSSDTYTNRLSTQVNYFHNPALYTPLKLPFCAYTIVANVVRVDFHQPLLRILLEFKHSLKLPTALFFLAHGVVNRSNASRQKYRFWWSQIYAFMESQPHTGMWLRLFVERHYTRLFNDHLLHRVVATDKGHSLYVTACDHEVRDALTEHLPFVPYTTTLVKAISLHHNGGTVELDENGETTRRIHQLNETGRNAVTRFWRARKLVLLASFADQSQ